MLAHAAINHAAGSIGPEQLVVGLIVAAVLLFAASPFWTWERHHR